MRTVLHVRWPRIITIEGLYTEEQKPSLGPRPSVDEDLTGWDTL